MKDSFPLQKCWLGLAAAGWLAAGAPLHASVVAVDWDGLNNNYTASGNRVFDLPTPDDHPGGVRTFPYSDTDPISPTASYNGPVFYGALQHIDGSGAHSNFLRSRVAWIAAENRNEIQLRSVVEDGINSVSGLIFFKKEDFLGGLDTAGPLSFDSDSLFSMNIEVFPGGITGPDGRRARFAVQNDGTWYLSEDFASLPGLFTLSDPADANWAEWDPDTSPLAAQPSVFTVPGSDFANIEAVGFYFIQSREDNQAVFEVSTFSASLIPEPHSLALLAMGALALLGRRRRRAAGA